MWKPKEIDGRWYVESDDGVLRPATANLEKWARHAAERLNEEERNTCPSCGFGRCSVRHQMACCED